MFTVYTFIILNIEYPVALAVEGVEVGFATGTGVLGSRGGGCGRAIVAAARVNCCNCDFSSLFSRLMNNDSSLLRKFVRNMQQDPMFLML